MSGLLHVERRGLLAAGAALGVLAAIAFLLAVARGPVGLVPEAQWILSYSDDVEIIACFPSPHEDATVVTLAHSTETVKPPAIELVNLPAPAEAPELRAIFCRETPARPKLPRVSFHSEWLESDALRWLAEHQQADGGWSFDHRGGACGGRCSHPGARADARRAATGLALLAFLSAGQTHREGAYKQRVTAGVRFLLARMTREGSVWEHGGGMTSHGIASAALCELYAMTHDSGLLRPAQLTLDFSCAAQDPRGGGWGCEPRTPGRPIASGWQIVALKSGHMAYLHVPPEKIRLARGFFEPLGAEEEHSAFAVLGRQYLSIGTREERDEAARELAQRGPAAENWLANYFASEALHAAGGEEWKGWRNALREQFALSQARQGHEKGSWLAARDPAARAGGRVYSTALALLTLRALNRKWPGGVFRLRDDERFEL